MCMQWNPNPGMRAVLATRCPRAQLLDGTIMSTVLPTKVEVGLISHVFYHVPDHKAALDNLRREGVLPRLKNDRSIC